MDGGRGPWRSGGRSIITAGGGATPSLISQSKASSHLEEPHASLSPMAELLKWNPTSEALVQDAAQGVNITLLVYPGPVEQLGGLSEQSGKESDSWESGWSGNWWERTVTLLSVK